MRLLGLLPLLQLLLLQVLIQLQMVTLTFGAPYQRRWSSFNRRNRHFKPFQPVSARFAAPLQGFSNIFQRPQDDTGAAWKAQSRFPSIASKAWGKYPASMARLQPLPTVKTNFQSFPVPQGNSFSGRKHQFTKIKNIRKSQVSPTFLSESDLHGLVCIPASSLASALGGHRDDQVTTSPDGKVTVHRTVLAGKDGDTHHSTRITSGADTTVVETRTNASTGHQQHRQSVSKTGAGLVRTSTGASFSRGQPGRASFSDVLTALSSEGGTSTAHATAFGFGKDKQVPSSSLSQSGSGENLRVNTGYDERPEITPKVVEVTPEVTGSTEAPQTDSELPESTQALPEGSEAAEASQDDNAAESDANLDDLETGEDIEMDEDEMENGEGMDTENEEEDDDDDE